MPAEQPLPPAIPAGDLVLQPLSQDQADTLVGGDLSGVHPAEGWPHEDTMDGLAGVAQGRSLGWLAMLGEQVVGDCGTHGPPDAAGMVEIGYGLAAPYRGRGYGRDLVRALSRWWAAQPGITAVLAHTDPGNLPSRRSLESAGFRLDSEENGECRYVLAVTRGG